MNDVLTQETTTQVDAWVYLATLAVPFIVAVINRPSFSPALKRGIQIGTAVVIAGVLMWLRGDLDDLGSGNFLQKVVVLVGLAQVWYAALAAIPATRRFLNRIEVKTTPKVDATLGAQQQEAVKAKAAETFTQDVMLPPAA